MAYLPQNLCQPQHLLVPTAPYGIESCKSSSPNEHNNILVALAQALAILGSKQHFNTCFCCSMLNI